MKDNISEKTVIHEAPIKPYLGMIIKLKAILNAIVKSEIKIIDFKYLPDENNTLIAGT